MEREEARIQGLPITGLQLLQSNISHNDQTQCNNCKTSVLDIHRSCQNCAYNLCVTCCREIRDGFLRANHHHPMHNEGCNFTTKDGSLGAAFLCMDKSNVVSKWILTNKGTIVCPPESMGGCGRWYLELKSAYPDNWVSELLSKAEIIAKAGKVTDGPESSEGACSCWRSHQGNELECATLLASQEESKDNFLHYPTILNIEKNDMKHFQCHLSQGEPAIVPNVLNGTPGLSWVPLVVWRACRKPRQTDHSYIPDFRVLNSSNCCEETINMRQFFKGYVEGLFDSESWPKFLKLEDWPPAESFRERLPRHFWEFVRCLPFRHYTHPHARYLNMSANIPNISLKSDFWPKMCICYGVSQELGFGSVTKIHCALSDRVNILMHTAAICLSSERLSTIKKLRMAHVTQDPVLFSVSNERAMEEVVKNQHYQMENENKGQERCDPSISRSEVKGLEDLEGGAIWDVFRRQDVPKL